MPKNLIDRFAVILRFDDIPADAPAVGQAVPQPAQEPADYFKQWVNDRCRLLDIDGQQAFDLWATVKDLVVGINGASRLAALPIGEVERLLRREYPGELGERALAVWRWAGTRPAATSGQPASAARWRLASQPRRAALATRPASGP